MKFKSVPQINEPLSTIGFGCWATGGEQIWNGTSDTASIQTIQRALDLGVNFFDVAPVYGLGHAETVLGLALRGRREQAFIATKCGLVWDAQKRVTNNLTALSLPQQIEDSLQRLQTDYIDLLQMHWPDPSTPIEESMEALLQLQSTGKIRYIGVSNFSLSLTQQAQEVGLIASYQGLYNLLERNPDSYHNIPLTYQTRNEILPLCEQTGMAFLPYSPLFQGLLTGTFHIQDNFDHDDVRSDNPKLGGEQFKSYFKITEKLKLFAQEIGYPLTQVAINWLRAQKVVTSIICGAQTVDHIEENVGSITWDLTPEMMTQLEVLLAPYDDLL